MKELLTKKFWQDVKKTFDEAREESSNRGYLQAASPEKANSKGSQPAEDPASQEATHSPG